MTDSRSHSRSPRSPREKSPAQQKRTSLLVRNIVLLKKDSHIKPDELRSFFSDFGEVRDVYIPRDYYSQKSRGFCFVEFLRYDDAKKALEKTDGTEVLGKTVKIVFAREGRKAINTDVEGAALQDVGTREEGKSYSVTVEPRPEDGQDATHSQVQGNETIIMKPRY